MSAKQNEKKVASRPEPMPKSEKKQPETVNLSAEELRKISGGIAQTLPRTPKP